MKSVRTAVVVAVSALVLLSSGCKGDGGVKQVPASGATIVVHTLG